MKQITTLTIAGLSISLALLGGSVASIQAAAGGILSVAVKDGKGMPVRNAVVMVYPAAGGTGSPYRSASNVMSQRDIQFDPGTLIVAEGASVQFPNRDRVRHNVYSFSKAAKFEIKLYGRDQSRSKTFSTAGTVALGCNIHDQMKGFIKVVDTPFAAKTDHNGLLQIKGLPGGHSKVKVWHPKNRVRGGETALSVTIARNGVTKQTMKLSLRR